MIIFKKRYYVKQLWKYTKDPRNPYGFKSDRVPIRELESFIHKEAWRKAFSFKSNFLNNLLLPNSYNLYKDAEEYLGYAVDDGYVEKNKFGYKMLSLGKRYISWWYPLTILFNNWVVKNIIQLLIGAGIGWFLRGLK